MGNTRTGAVAKRKTSVEGPARKPASSLAIAERGVQSSSDFRDLMSALMSDVIRGSLNPMVTNAAVNAGGKLLKMVELEYKLSSDTRRRDSSLKMAGPLLGK